MKRAQSNKELKLNEYYWIDFDRIRHWSHKYSHVQQTFRSLDIFGFFWYVLVPCVFGIMWNSWRWEENVKNVFVNKWLNAFCPVANVMDYKAWLVTKSIFVYSIYKYKYKYYCDCGCYSCFKMSLGIIVKPPRDDQYFINPVYEICQETINYVLECGLRVFYVYNT